MGIAGWLRLVMIQIATFLKIKNALYDLERHGLSHAGFFPLYEMTVL